MVYSSSMSFLSNINWRYATKKFNGKLVSEADLSTILEAIRLAPSSSGTQPYHIAVTSGALKDKLIESSGQTDKLGASHLLVFCSRIDYPERAKKQVEITAEMEGTTVDALGGLSAALERATSKLPESLRQWAARQAYIALGFGLAACAELSIDSCPMEGFKPEEFHKILGLPEFMTPVVIMTLGYRDSNDTTQPPMRPKIRFPKDDLFEFR